MDYTILYVILVIGITFGVSYLVSHLRHKNIIKQVDLKFAMDMLDIGLRVVSELNLQKEAEIAKLSSAVINSLEYAISFYDTEKDVVNSAYEYSLELCEVINVDLTDARKDLLMELITIVFNDKYIQFIDE